jgi:hypothetical protein
MSERLPRSRHRHLLALLPIVTLCGAACAPEVPEILTAASLEEAQSLAAVGTDLIVVEFWKHH